MTQIKANELRVGNWVYFQGIPEQITPVGIMYQSEVNNITTSDVSPIPLTLKILKKCGFIKRQYGVYGIPLSTKSDFWIVNFGDMGDFYILQFKSAGITPPCKYLHQLQNLYFALTGEELKYEL